MKPLQQFDAEALYADLARQISAALPHYTEVAVVGIYSGGAWLADRLVTDCGLTHPAGYIDVSFYRDDYAQKGLPASVKASRIPFNVEGATIILVDDVLFTGRTTRAAINELFDYGRPAKILLAALVDRGGRQLPFAPDFVGQTLLLEEHLSLVLTRADTGDGQAGDKRLVLSLIDKNNELSAPSAS